MVMQREEGGDVQISVVCTGQRHCGVDFICIFRLVLPIKLARRPTRTMDVEWCRRKCAVGMLP